MKKAERNVYVELTGMMGIQLCFACRYAQLEGYGCDEGYFSCKHPLDFRLDEEGCSEPGWDCWGFRPDIETDLLADIAGVIISQQQKIWWITLGNRPGDKARVHFAGAAV